MNLDLDSRNYEEYEGNEDVVSADKDLLVLPFRILIPTSIDFICLSNFPMKMRISCHFTTLGRSISCFLVIDHRLESFHELLSKVQAL